MSSTATAQSLGPAEETISKQEAIVAALCAEAPTEAVRNCLRKYEPRKPSWQIEAAFKTLRKQTLVDALFYLKVPHMEQYKVDILPHELLCRVQNLFPDLCHLCKQEYCVALNDDPIIHCASCGQGCHDHCVLQLLGITRDDLNDENENGIKLLNPHASIGLVYLCEPCQKTVLPQKEKIKSKGPRGSGNAVEQSQSQPPSSQTDPQYTGVTPPDSVNSSHDSTPSENEVANVPEHGDNTANQKIREQQQLAPPANNSQLMHRERGPRRSANSTNNPPLNSQQPVCKYYKQGRCRYGISGKKDGVCPFSHPKACQRFLTNGSNRKRGCSKNDCSFFHPSMCHSSMSDRTC